MRFDCTVYVTSFEFPYKWLKNFLFALLVAIFNEFTDLSFQLSNGVSSERLEFALIREYFIKFVIVFILILILILNLYLVVSARSVFYVKIIRRFKKSDQYFANISSESYVVHLVVKAYRADYGLI